MDWEFKLISLFLFISKHYDKELCVCCERLSNNNTPKISDDEIICIYIWGIMRGSSKVKNKHRLNYSCGQFIILVETGYYRYFFFFSTTTPITLYSLLLDSSISSYLGFSG